MSIREWIDQAAHYAIGYAMARSLKGISDKTRRDKVEFVMRWVREREDWQHPDKERGPDGFYGDGSRRDEKWFRKGAEAGVE